MKISWTALCCLCYYYCINSWFVLSASSPTCVNVDDWIKRGRALDNSVFWTGTSVDITECATNCIRRKICQSFNYDLVTFKCELNLATGEPNRRGSLGLIFSDINPWLQDQFDASCALRPCSDQEVCLPGAIAKNAASITEPCSYICLPSQMVCPMPFPGFSGDRTVGAVTTFTCDHGYIGGDTAECLITKQWNKPINMDCQLMHGHSCSADSECADVGATCIGGICECSNIEFYDETDMLCKNRFKLDGGSGNYGRLRVHNNGAWGTVRHEDWVWTASLAMCKDIDPTFVYGGAIYDFTTAESGAKSYKLKDLECSAADCKSTMADYTYTFEDKDNDYSKDVGLHCYDHNITGDIRLNTAISNGGKFKLEVQYNGVWGSVCGDDWPNKADDTACFSIDPTRPKKDSEKKDEFVDTNDLYLIDSVRCSGEEDHFFYCRNGGWENTHTCGKVVGLSCKEP